MVILLYIRKVPNFYPKQLPPCAHRTTHQQYESYSCILCCIRILQGFVPLPGMVGYGATVWDPPSDLPPQKYGTWYPGGVRPTPPELRNMMPGISGITT